MIDSIIDFSLKRGKVDIGGLTLTVAGEPGVRPYDTGPAGSDGRLRPYNASSICKLFTAPSNVLTSITAVAFFCFIAEITG